MAFFFHYSALPLSFICLCLLYLCVNSCLHSIVLLFSHFRFISLFLYQSPLISTSKSKYECVCVSLSLSLSFPLFHLLTFFHLSLFHFDAVKFFTWNLYPFLSIREMVKSSSCVGNQSYSASLCQSDHLSKIIISSTHNISHSFQTVLTPLNPFFCLSYIYVF